MFIFLKYSFDYSSNNNSKVSGPLRESELLDYNLRNGGGNRNQDLEYNTRDVMMQSQEKRLPLSKISYENSGAQPERVTNGINSTYLGHINEVPEDQQRLAGGQPSYNQGYEDYNEEEPVPVPKLSLPTPHTLTTNYKEARDQKKWNKVNNGANAY